MYTLAVDAMGGRFGAGNHRTGLPGGAARLRRYPYPALRPRGGNPGRSSPAKRDDESGASDILDARDVITNDEAPMFAVRHKTDSSLVRAAMDVRAGNSGATHFRRVHRRGAGLRDAAHRAHRGRRPSGAGGDSAQYERRARHAARRGGANVDCCRPEDLPRFAQMGDIYARQVLGIQNPRVGLLNIGEEEEKGCQLTKATYALLKKAKLNFTGNVEARGVLNGGADVIVCDGDHGNLVIKASEGAISAIFYDAPARAERHVHLRSSARRVSRPAFRRVKRRMDVNEVGGGPLLGVRGAVVKPDGNSTGDAFFCCLRQARQTPAGNVVEIIEQLEQIEGGKRKKCLKRLPRLSPNSSRSIRRRSSPNPACWRTWRADSANIMMLIMDVELRAGHRGGRRRAHADEDGGRRGEVSRIETVSDEESGFPAKGARLFLPG